MLQENNTKVLIFGYGSVGKKYANYFLKKKFQVIIFDPYKKRDNSKITIIRSYKDLLNLKKKNLLFSNLLISRRSLFKL